MSKNKILIYLNNKKMVVYYINQFFKFDFNEKF